MVHTCRGRQSTSMTLESVQVICVTLSHGRRAIKPILERIWDKSELHIAKHFA